MAHNVSGVAELFGWRGSCLARDVTAGKLAWRARQGPEAATPQLGAVRSPRLQPASLLMHRDQPGSHALRHIFLYELQISSPPPLLRPSPDRLSNPLEASNQFIPLPARRPDLGPTR